MAKVNPWTGSGYDENEYYLASHDEKGHGASFQVQLPPDALARVNALCDNKDHPYRSKQDVVRDALIHLVFRREAEKPDPAQHHQIRWYANSLRRKQRQDLIYRLSATIDEIAMALKIADKSGDPQMLKTELDEARELYDIFPPKLLEQVQKLVEEHEQKLTDMIRKVNQTERVNDRIHRLG